MRRRRDVKKAPSSLSLPLSPFVDRGGVEVPERASTMEQKDLLHCMMRAGAK